MDATFSADRLKSLQHALSCINKLGETLNLQAQYSQHAPNTVKLAKQPVTPAKGRDKAPDHDAATIEVRISAINSSSSAFCAFVLAQDTFFDSVRFHRRSKHRPPLRPATPTASQTPPQPPPANVECQINVRSLMASLKTSSNRNLERCHLSITDGRAGPGGGDTGAPCRITVRLHHQHGLTKTHTLTYEAQPGLFPSANPDPGCTVLAAPHSVAEWLQHFSTHAGSASAGGSGAATAAGGGDITLCFGRDFCSVRSSADSYDGSSARPPGSTAAPRGPRPIETEVKIDVAAQFELYHVPREACLTLPLREFRAAVTLAENLMAPLELSFSTGGEPLFLRVNAEMIRAEMVIATTEGKLPEGRGGKEGGGKEGAAATATAKESTASSGAKSSASASASSVSSGPKEGAAPVQPPPQLQPQPRPGNPSSQHSGFHPSPRTPGLRARPADESQSRNQPQSQGPPLSQSHSGSQPPSQSQSLPIPSLRRSQQPLQSTLPPPQPPRQPQRAVSGGRVPNANAGERERDRGREKAVSAPAPAARGVGQQQQQQQGRSGGRVAAEGQEDREEAGAEAEGEWEEEEGPRTQESTSANALFLGGVPDSQEESVAAAALRGVSAVPSRRSAGPGPEVEVRRRTGRMGSDTAGEKTRGGEGQHQRGKEGERDVRGERSGYSSASRSGSGSAVPVSVQVQGQSEAEVEALAAAGPGGGGGTLQPQGSSLGEREGEGEGDSADLAAAAASAEDQRSFFASSPDDDDDDDGVEESGEEEEEEEIPGTQAPPTRLAPPSRGVQNQGEDQDEDQDADEEQAPVPSLDYPYARSGASAAGRPPGKRFHTGRRVTYRKRRRSVSGSVSGCGGVGASGGEEERDEEQEQEEQQRTGGKKFMSIF